MVKLLFNIMQNNVYVRQNSTQSTSIGAWTHWTTTVNKQWIKQLHLAQPTAFMFKAVPATQVSCKKVEGSLYFPHWNSKAIFTRMHILLCTQSWQRDWRALRKRVVAVLAVQRCDESSKVRRHRSGALFVTWNVERSALELVALCQKEPELKIFVATIGNHFSTYMSFSTFDMDTRTECAGFEK